MLRIAALLVVIGATLAAGPVEAQSGTFFNDTPPRPPADGQMPVKPFGLQQHIHDMVQPDVGTVADQRMVTCTTQVRAVLHGRPAGR